MTRLAYYKHWRKTDSTRVRHRQKFLNWCADVIERLAGTATPVVFTASAATNEITSAAHNLHSGYAIRVSTAGGELPAPLQADTDYFVIWTGVNTFRLAATEAAGLNHGPAIDLTTDGTPTLNYVHVGTVHRIIHELRTPPRKTAAQIQDATDIDNL